MFRLNRISYQCYVFVIISNANITNLNSLVHKTIGRNQVLFSFRLLLSACSLAAIVLCTFTCTYLCIISYKAGILIGVRLFARSPITTRIHLHTYTHAFKCLFWVTKFGRSCTNLPLRIRK